ncbi:MAG: acyl-CoA dehydrogenase family protein [Acidobacteria bacterium]|nr:acyl-CoA dehydrogenase family protein [Acidobacteriota bacterium]
MSTLTETAGRIRGAAFLLESQEISFTPEDFTEEHRMIARTTEEFVQREVLPRLEEMERGQKSANVELLRRAAEIGLLSADIAEEYGGLGLDKVSSTLIAEGVGSAASFAATFGAHSGIGTLPIAFFGTEAQKRKYLPELAAARLVAAYALTEAESGSDALAAKTGATPSADGREYLLNGTKMWITNAGFADIFIVFAKVDGEKFSAFIVERQLPGVSVGAEEKKMGIHGSSTCAVILDNVRVPSENLLGEVGKGHRIALNILNIGRYKLAASCVGAARTVLQEAVRYARQRHQFGKPIASFGAIQEKIARMAARQWTGESMLYRAVGCIDQALASAETSAEQLNAIEEYAVECSVLKVFCSELLDDATDQGVQILGGNGYSREYPMERYYRDSRINRIFEGTNEINRLLIPAMIARRSLRGELPFLAAAKKLQGEILSLETPPAAAGAFGAEQAVVSGMKRSALLLGGLLMQKFGERLADEQELLLLLADIVIEVYAAESGLLRARQAAGRASSETAGAFADMARSYLYQAAQTAEAKAREALPALAEGDTLRTYQSVLRKFFRSSPVSQIELRRRIAQRLIAGS